jgi:uncharacterized protein YciI
MSSRLNWLGGVMLAVVSIGCSAEEPPPGTTLDLWSARPTYLVVYQRGESWERGKPLREQKAIPEHFNYYLELHRKGSLVGAGGFTDESGGAAVFEAKDDTAAEQFIASDPAVLSGTFRYELRRWKLNPWEEISTKRADRGE